MTRQESDHDRPPTAAVRAHDRETENALRALLTNALDRTGLDYPNWVALTIVTRSCSPTPVTDLISNCRYKRQARRKERRGWFHMNRAEIRELMNDRVAQKLIQAPIHARLAYTAKDGSPRVIPIGYIWNGDVFVMGSAPNAPKVEALSANPKVALTIDTDDFHQTSSWYGARRHASASMAYLTNSSRPPEDLLEMRACRNWEAGARGLYKQMVLLRITPTWAKIIDFETRLPAYVEELVKAQ